MLGKRTQREVAHWLTAALMAVVGAGLLWWTARSVWLQEQTRTWPSAPAVLIGASVDVDEDSDGSTTYSPSVSYTYEVDGQRYEATRIGFVSDGDYDRSEYDSAAKVAQHWSAQRDTLRAFYDPAQPSRACLAPGGEVAWGTLLGMLVIGGGMLAIGLWMVKTGPD